MMKDWVTHLWLPCDWLQPSALEAHQGSVFAFVLSCECINRESASAADDDCAAEMPPYFNMTTSVQHNRACVLEGGAFDVLDNVQVGLVLCVLDPLDREVGYAAAAGQLALLCRCDCHALSCVLAGAVFDLRRR